MRVIAIDGPAGSGKSTVARAVADRVTVDGEDATAEIRGPQVTKAVSAVAANPGVRVELVERQRRWADDHEGGVVEGRDIGSVVFPEAELKVYLTASDEERARRRAAEASADDVSEVAADIARRDQVDATRSVSPMMAAPDAVVIDTTGRGVDDIVNEILERIER